jgi:diguanylate cyclase (GGDEF)-like protein/PAS domain S-box-containing protein
MKENILKQIMASERFIDELIHEELLNTIQDLVFIVRVEEPFVFRYTYMNKRAMTHARLTEQAYEKMFQEVLSPELAEALQQVYEKVVQQKQVYIFQDVVRTVERDEHYESLLNPIVVDDVCKYVVCITRNITDRIQEQNRLVESQMRYESLLEYNSDAIVSLDEKGIIGYANPAAYSMFGYGPKDLTGRPMIEYVSKENQTVYEKAFFSTLKGESVEIALQSCQDVHGNLLYVHLKTIPIIINDEIKGMYMVARDITHQALNDLQTKYFAYYDQLTGLQNHISCTKTLSEWLTKEQKFAVILVDLDGFRMVNDTYGHKEGDEVLKEVARRLEKNVGSAQVFRQHGDQFVILTQEHEQQRVEETARRIQAIFQQSFLIQGEGFHLGASIGIVLYPEHGNDEKTLLKRADFALDASKEQGKSHYNFYDNRQDDAKEAQLSLKTNMNRALERGEFQLYYQPQVNLLNQKVMGMEALIRWHNKELGNVRPDIFIPLAERTGLIFKIDEWVLFEACRQLREWIDAGYQPVPIAVNVSGKQFRSQRIIETIDDALHKYRISSDLLVIEITEGALMHDEKSEQVLNELKRRGISIHLDDFGTGYSSLSYLKRYPIDTIKIDRSFIQEVNADERDAKITTAIIHLAQTLGLEVIAEGVEDVEQIRFLKQKNAVYAQGYYFEKPLPAPEMEHLYLVDE